MGMQKGLRCEKSCGAVIFYRFEEGYKVLLIGFMHGGELRWGFPKGHMENGETEEQTAIREIKEEVGLDVDIIPGFKTSVHFCCKVGTLSEAVYYCAQAKSINTKAQKGEVEQIKWLNFKDAQSHLTYDCDKEVLAKFTEFFNKVYA